MAPPVQPRPSADAAAFRRWLERNHASETELLVRCAKVAAGTRGLTYRQALDEALCFGWIDGVRRGLDAVSFSVRFTPRKLKSAWSTVNIARARQLIKAGRMRPPGLAAFRKRTKSQYSFESRPAVLPPAVREALRARPNAWRFFESQAPWYRRTVAFWILSAKRPETRARRLGLLIESSAEGRRVPPLTRPGTSK